MIRAKDILIKSKSGKVWAPLAHLTSNVEIHINERQCRMCPTWFKIPSRSVNKVHCSTRCRVKSQNETAKRNRTGPYKRRPNRVRVPGLVHPFKPKTR